MATRIQLRRGSAAQWASANPVLFAGEPAVETDTGKVKVGDGATAWASLPYILDEADLASSAALRAASVAAAAEAIDDTATALGAAAAAAFVPAGPTLRRINGYTRGQVPVTTRLMATQAVQDNTMLSDGVATSKFHRLKVTVTADATDLRLVFGNYYYGTAGPNPITVTAAIETNNPAVSHPVTFGAAASVTLAPDAVVTSDPVSIRVTKGDVLWLRTYVSVATAGQKWPLSTNYSQTGDAVTADTDQTAGTGTTGLTAPLLGQQYIRGFAPVAVLGTPRDASLPVFALYGDSIEVGLNDFNADPFRGFADRALNGQYPYFNLSRHAERASQVVPLAGAGSGQGFAPVSYRHKMRLLSACTHVISNYGTNELTDTVNTIKANMVAFWADLTARGLKTWHTTLLPRTTSTDLWTTLANQTITAQEPNRLAINAWLRDGAPIVNGAHAAVGTAGASRCAVYDVTGAVVAPASGPAGHPLRGVLETADAVESARDSGLWKLGPSGTATITNGSNQLTNVTGTGWVIGDQMNAPGVPGFSTISSVSGTTIFLLAAATASATGAAISQPMTRDGVHPQKIAHLLMAAALPIATIAAS